MSSAMTITMSSAISPNFVTSATSKLILQPFRRSTYVTAHSPTLPLLHLCHSSFSNLSFASPTSQALRLIHLASRPCIRPCDGASGVADRHPSCSQTFNKEFIASHPSTRPPLVHELTFLVIRPIIIRVYYYGLSPPLWSKW